jgi:hypothetical protein
VVVAARDGDSVRREDERRVAYLEHARLGGGVGRTALPRLRRPAGDLAGAARLSRGGVDEERVPLEQRRDRLAVVEDECVFEQGIKLVGRSRSRSHRRGR